MRKTLHLLFLLLLSTQLNAQYISTISSDFDAPEQSIVDDQGNIYIADTDLNQILRILPDGTREVFAGNGVGNLVDGFRLDASFNYPIGLAIDEAQNIYVSEGLNYAIRKIDVTGNVTTLFGGSDGNLDGNFNNARITNVAYLAYHNNILYLAQAGETSVIRRIDLINETVSTYAGGGSPGDLDGNGTSAFFNGCRGILIDDNGVLYIADTFNNKIKKIDTNGDVTTIAGTGQAGHNDGSALFAQFNGPKGLAMDVDGNIYIADRLNWVVRMMDPDGIVSTLIGMPGDPGNVDGYVDVAKVGRAVDVTYEEPNLIVSDWGNSSVRRVILPTGNEDIDNDGYIASEDCDDLNPDINPGQDEIIYNGLDDDCDPATLDDDLDQDGYIMDEDCDDMDANVNPSNDEIPYNGLDDDCDPSTLDDDVDQDGYGIDEDCDDNNPNVNPGQEEVPWTGIDEDCDSTTLDDDIDQDGFGLDFDCDDLNPDVNPDQTEIPYNGLDDDCNDETLDDDLDGDGFNIDEDCDDTDPNVNPDQVEIPSNGIDDDCDSATPDNDADQDGYGDDVDCDDNNPNINPGQDEIPYNNIDDDCDPSTLDDDFDQDGYASADDCDDDNPDINPGQEEIPYNGIDDDCNPNTWDDDVDQDGFLAAEDCDDMNELVNPNQEEIPYNGFDDDCDPETLDNDLDQDGFFDKLDCDDTNPDINPDADEIPYNGLDDDCNEASLDDDLDQDGFGIETDCDDTNPDINPDALEIPGNDVDENCDGIVVSTQNLSGVQFEIYPNPTSHFVYIQMDTDMEFNLSVYSIEGKLMLNEDNLMLVDLSNYAQGMYVFIIKNMQTNETIIDRIELMK